MDGIILINKEKGYTSHDIVNKVRKKLNIKKVGHAGTLDPLATGILPILIGKGTKLSKYLIEHDKTYIANIKLGIKTATGDLEGDIIKKTENVNIDELAIKNLLKTFIGKQKQIPPMYSAIKINGKKLYEYARASENVEITPRDIEIYDIYLNNYDKEKQEVKITAHVSKGTYIRTLCENIAEKLGTIGTMKELERIKVNQFTIEKSVYIDDFKQEDIISIEEIFNTKSDIILNNIELQKLLNGILIEKNLPNDLYKIYNVKNEFIGIGIIENNLLKRDVIVYN